MLGGNAARWQQLEEDNRILALRSAARTVSSCLTRDEQQIPDPWDLLRSSYSRDYLSISTPEQLLQVKQVHVIPDVLLAQFEGVECRCFMGIFAEIGRVWMSVNNRLFLWDFATGRDFTCYEDLKQVIIDVVLVRPKAGIFVSAIKHILVVVTTTEVHLLGISFAQETESLGSCDLILHRTGLKFPTDEINMLSVVGGPKGRIFAGGQDGNVYEFQYQSEEGWFTRKCRKMNRTSSVLSYFTPTFLRLAGTGSPVISMVSDNDRGLLYALGDDSAIQMFATGLDEETFEKVVTFNDIYDQASRLCASGVINRTSFKVVSIYVVDPADSVYIHLMAVTTSGIRLFFTTLSRDQRVWARSQLLGSRQPSLRLDLVHVRLPSDEVHMRDPRRLVHRWSPTNIHTAFLRHGVSIIASDVSDQEDSVHMMCLNQALVMSSQRSGPLEILLDVSAVEGKVWDIAEMEPSSRVNEFSASFHESILSDAKPRQFLVLTNTGIYVLAKSTPLDIIQTLLVESGGNAESEALKSFFESYTPEQACFLATQLACSMQKSWRSFGNGKLDSMLSANLSIWAVNAMLNHGGEPKFYESSLPLSDGALGNRVEYEFSPLHRGLLLYFSRLVGPVWRQSILKFRDPSTDLLMSIHAFCEFLSRSPSLTSRKPKDMKSSSRLEEAFAAESGSIQSLLTLARSTLELFSFLSICRDYGVLDSHLSGTSSISIDEILSSGRGRHVIAELGNALVQKQLQMRSSVESLCQILLQRCPLFFGEADVIIYQGHEALERALEARDPRDRSSNLAESLRMFISGASVLSLPTLSDICHKYQKLAFFPGIMDLCLSVIPFIDPDNVALLASQSSAAVLESNIQEIINLRDSVYALIFDALLAVHGIGTKTMLVISQDIDVDFLQKETLLRTVRTRDELFHRRLYDWLINEGFIGVLLDLETSFIIPYLREKFSLHLPVNRDLLWKYLARHNFPIEAAKNLYELALSSDLYAITMDVADFIQEVEERLDVANVQVELLEQVHCLYGNVAEAEDLNTMLRFARPLKLWELSLQILHTAGYQDNLLVHQLWQDIIKKELARHNFAGLAQKIAELVRKLYPSHFAFPLNFVVDSVMQAAIEGCQSADWVVTAFVSSGVPAIDLFEQLHEFTETQAIFWTRSENRRFLVDCIFITLGRGWDQIVPLVPGIKSRLLKYKESINGDTSMLSQLNLLLERIK